jgi:hypothetical protein
MSRVLIAAIAVAGLAFSAAPYVAAAEVAGAASAVPAAKRIQGILISVSDKKIVIGQKKNEEHFKTDGKTEVVIDGAKKTLADLKVEMKVVVTVEKDVATKIEVKTASRKK